MRPRIGRLGIVGVAAIVQLAVLVLAHDLVYLARYGSRYGEALVHSGHGGAWQAAVISSVLLGGVAALAVAARLLRLQVLIQRQRASGSDGGLDGTALVHTWLRIGSALAIGAVALLTVQENVEQAAIHGTAAGIGILLTPEYARGLWIALAVGLVVGFVVALVAWRLEILEARLRAARTASHPGRSSAARRPVARAGRPASSILGRRSALRAPPAGSPAS